MNRLLTVKHSAKKLKVSERTVWNYLKSGFLKPTKINPGKIKSGKTFIHIDQINKVLRG